MTFQVGRITPGWYLVAVTFERLKKDRAYVTASAFYRCPLDPAGPAGEPVIEVDGVEVPDEELWDWWTRLPHYPITRAEYNRRRGVE